MERYMELVWIADAAAAGALLTVPADGTADTIFEKGGASSLIEGDGCFILCKRSTQIEKEDNVGMGVIFKGTHHQPAALIAELVVDPAQGIPWLIRSYLMCILPAAGLFLSALQQRLA